MPETQTKPQTPEQTFEPNQIVALTDSKYPNTYRVMAVTTEPVAQLVDLVFAEDGTATHNLIYMPTRLITMVPQYQGDELWTQVTMLIAMKLARLQLSPMDEVEEYQLKAVRHQVYRLIGGNHIKVTDDIRQRVRELCDRAIEALRYA